MKTSSAVALCRILAFAGAAALVGCGPKQVEQAASPIFYPPAPDPPRLQFLMSFSSAQGWSQRKASFSDFIVGQEASVEGDITAPYGLAARDGKVYICDLGNRTVHVVDMAKKAYAKLGGSKLLQNPVTITIAADGTKYVCDTGLRKVAVFDAQDRFVRFLGDPAKCNPSALAIYGEELFVTDVGGAEVEVWTAGSSG
jgi:hypothetical protein